MKVLITGVAGFIGMHTAVTLVKNGYEVIGIDNFDNYYDVELKKNRIKNIKNQYENKFKFFELDIIENRLLKKNLKNINPDIIIHLAAQAGVNYSISNPGNYIQSNLVGFANILEFCRHNKVKHLMYASSSSVYGLNTKLPFSTKDDTSHPISLYAATKRSNELMAHSYSHLYQLPTTGLRFFTVYGPWGRPDMSLFKFTKNIFNGEKIDVYNYGKHSRDFTYIDDVTNAIAKLINLIPQTNPEWTSGLKTLNESSAPWKIYNIGNNNPIKLTSFIKIIEKECKKKANINFLPLQNGDVPKTFADIQDLFETIEFKPEVTIEEGISSFVSWFKKYYKI